MRKMGKETMREISKQERHERETKMRTRNREEE